MATTQPAAKPRTRATPATRKKSNRNGTGALFGAAAAGVAMGVAAMIGRKVAVQAPTRLAGDWDQALAAEHVATLKIFDALEATTVANTVKRSMLLMQLKHALSKHALQEESTVYPALRDAGEVEGADQLNHEQGYAKQHLYRLSNCPTDSIAFLDIVRKFRSDLVSHMRDEEDTLFPALKSKLSEAENKALTTAMNKEGFKLA